MKKEFCVLFDMDGVLLDTETQYSKIWKHVGKKYNAGIENFEQKIKGTTLNNILAKYFSHLGKQEVENMTNELYAFEEMMDYVSEIVGATKFVEELKNNGIKVGLVTSSDDIKLNSVYKQNDLRKTMDTIVSANRITKGKPDPMCYLLAAKDLGYEPQNCFVFEDSFAGLESGNTAGMKVIGLATTHNREALEGKCLKIISDFTNINLSKLTEIYNEQN